MNKKASEKHNIIFVELKDDAPLENKTKLSLYNCTLVHSRYSVGEMHDQLSPLNLFTRISCKSTGVYLAGLRAIQASIL